jgi:tRNA G18 (ribose-2'-O)-methylase SpoU
LPPGVDATLPVYVVPHQWLREIIGFDFHRGVLACGLRPDNPELTELVARTAAESPTGVERLLVVCPHILDPTNLAGVVRNCTAFGANGLLLGPHCADAYSRRVVRVSMGTVFQLPVRTAGDLTADLIWLGQQRYHRVASVLDAAATVLTDARRTSRLALLFGSEGHGLERESIALCDEMVTLPMRLNTDSLNVATASGVFLYHYTQVAK